MPWSFIRTYVGTTLPATQLFGASEAPSSAVIVNIGGMSATTSFGPADVLLSESPSFTGGFKFILLPGGSISVPADIGDLYALAVTNPTVVNLAIASRPFRSQTIGP